MRAKPARLAQHATSIFRKDTNDSFLHGHPRGRGLPRAGRGGIRLYQTEICDIVRRRGAFGQRIKQVPATGHPSRFFEETAIVAPTAARPSSTRANRGDGGLAHARGASVPLKALVSQINYNLFDMEVGPAETVRLPAGQGPGRRGERVMRTHDVALWNGNDTSLSAPATPQYYGAAGQIAAGGNVATITTAQSIVDGLKSTVAAMVANGSFEVRPTAIYANPVLLDLIDREMKPEFNVVLSTTEMAGGLTVKTLSTQAGDLPLIPEWALSYTGTPGSGYAVLPAYIVTEELIEYHWLTDANPRVFRLGRRVAGAADGGGEVRRPGRQEASAAHYWWTCSDNAVVSSQSPVASSQTAVQMTAGD